MGVVKHKCLWEWEDVVICFASRLYIGNVRISQGCSQTVLGLDRIISGLKITYYCNGFLFIKFTDNTIIAHFLQSKSKKERQKNRLQNKNRCMFNLLIKIKSYY